MLEQPEFSSEAFSDLCDMNGKNFEEAMKPELFVSQCRQQTINEVVDTVIDEQLMDACHADHYADVSKGEFAEDGTLADELYTLRFHISKCEETLNLAVEKLGGLRDFEYEGVEYDYYDNSVTVSGVPAGWDPPLRLRLFLLKHAGFGTLYVIPVEGEETHWSWYDEALR